MTRTEEFDEFAAAAWPRLRRAAYLLTGDGHLAEDLAQTALVRTYAAWRRVRREDAFSYARRVLLNLNIDRIRRRSTRPTEIVADLPDLPERAGAIGARSGIEDREEVVHLLGALTERERRVVVLRHYYDLSEASVAAELKIARGTVKSTLARALAKLRVTAALDIQEMNR